VIAAGERWNADGRPLRPGLEDYLGAGAIVAAMTGGSLSPEARVAANAARSVDDVVATVAECASGRELITWDRPQDVALASEVDVSDTAPVLVDGVLVG
jgi:2-phosphosulfolactate phosphatase